MERELTEIEKEMIEQVQKFHRINNINVTLDIASIIDPVSVRHYTEIKELLSKVVAPPGWFDDDEDVEEQEEENQA